MQSAAFSKVKREHKKGLDKGDARRRRIERTLNIRKKKKDDQIKSRRRVMETEGKTAELLIDDAQIKQELPVLTQALHSQNVGQVLGAASRIRKIIAREVDPPLTAFFNQPGLIESVFQLLKSNNTDLVYEASWIFTNLCSDGSEHASERLQIMASHGLIHVMVNLMNHPSSQVVEQVIWCLYNIAGDNVTFRDQCLNLKILPNLHKILMKPGQVLKIMEHGSWLLSNLMRGNSPFVSNNFLPVEVFQMIFRLLQYNHDSVVADACWAMSYISEDSDNTHKMDMSFDTGIAAKILSLLSSDNMNILAPAARTLGNFISGSDVYCDRCLELNAIQALLHLFKSQSSRLRKEAMWTTSNICGGTLPQIEAVLNSPLLPIVIRAIYTEQSGIRREAMYALRHATDCCSAKHIQFMVQRGLVQALAQGFQSLTADIESTRNLLFVISRVLQSADNQNPNPMVDLMEEAGILDPLERLQEHKNQGIYEETVRILSRYFGAESLDEVDPVTAPTTDGQTFQFNPPSQAHRFPIVNTNSQPSWNFSTPSQPSGFATGFQF